MPDDDDFVINDTEHVMSESLGRGAGVPEGDSGILDVQVTDPDLLTIVREPVRVTVGFRNKSFPDEVSIAGYRAQVYQLLDDPACKTIRFDVEGVKLFPSGMLGLLVSVRNRGFLVEVVNASPDVMETLRITRLDTLVDIFEGAGP